MAITHKFKKGESLFSTTLSASISTGTGETITPASVVGLPTDTEITLTIDRVDANGNATPAKLERITGTISGGNLTAYTRGTDGTTEQAHASGAVVEYIWNSQDWNDLVDGILVGHNQDGTHDPAILYDSNGNEELKFTATASAVNEFTMVNAATGGSPALSVTGGDTNIDLTLTSKGTGGVIIPNTTSSTDGAIGFDRTNEDFSIGDGSTAKKIHMGAFVTTFTPTVTSSGGSITSYTASSAYAVVGKMVFISITITLANNGTGSGYVIATLPFNNAAGNYILSGRENVTEGKQLQGYITSNTCRIYDYANAYPGTTNSVLMVSGFYQAA